MQTPIIILVAALIAASALASYNRLLGAIAGMLITGGMGVWGYTAMEDGSQIAFFGKPLSPTLFYMFIGTLMLINVIQLIRGLRSRARS